MKPAFVVIPLLLAFQDAPPGPPDPAAELKALRAEHQKATAEYYKPYSEAKSDAERAKIKLDPAKLPDLVYIDKYKDLAERAKGTEAAAGALVEVLNLGMRTNRRPDSKAALETLLDAHLESPVMERVASGLRYAEHSLGEDTCRTALLAIEEKSPHPKAKAAAIFTRAVQGMARREEESRDAFARLQKDFAETSYAERAEAFLFELDHLRVGKVAPDFEATDEQGKKYKLSDYRGKITVVDFWGFW